MLSKLADKKKGLSRYFWSYKVALVVAVGLDIHNELTVIRCGLQKNNIIFNEMKPLIAGTVSNLTYLKTNDGKRLTERKET